MALTRIKLNQITQPLDQDLSVPSLSANGDITTTGNLSVGGNTAITGNLTVDGSVSFSSSNTAGTFTFGDGDKLQFGDSQDLEIYHDGQQSIIADTGTGNLSIRADDLIIYNADQTARMIDAYTGAYTRLYYNGSSKLATANTGVDITGDLTVSGDFTVSGNTTYVNTNDLSIEDLNITLAAGSANSAVADGAGITIEGANAQISWDHTNQRLSSNKNIYVSGPGGTGTVSKITVYNPDDGAGHPGATGILGSESWGEAFLKIGNLDLRASGGDIRYNTAGTDMVFRTQANTGFTFGTTWETPPEKFYVGANSRFDGQIGLNTTPSRDIHILSSAPSMRWQDDDTNDYADIVYNAGTYTIDIDPTSVDTNPRFRVDIHNSEVFRVDLNSHIIASSIELDSANVTTVNATTLNADTINGTFGNTVLNYTSTAPSGAVQGNFYFDQLNQRLKIYTGSAWVDAVPSSTGSSGNTASTDANSTFTKYQYDITSTTSTITGADSSNNTLSYDTSGIENVEVFVNGVKLVEGTDYVATTGTSIGLSDNVLAGSTVEVQVYELLTNDAYYLKTETYTQTETNQQISTALGSYIPYTDTSSARIFTIDGTGTTGKDAVLVLKTDVPEADEEANGRIIFNQDGNLEISAIGMNLNVTGRGGASYGNDLILANSIGSGGGIRLATGTTQGYTNATTRLLVQPDGKVVIGTPGDASNHDIPGTAHDNVIIKGDGIFITDASNMTYGFYDTIGSLPSARMLYNAGDRALDFYTGTATGSSESVHLRVDSVGRLSSVIGTTVFESQTSAAQFNIGFNGNDDTQVTGSISGTTLTVTATTKGALAAGMFIWGGKIKPRTMIVSDNGSGSYTLNVSHPTITSQEIYARDYNTGSIGFVDTDASVGQGQSFGNIIFKSYDSNGEGTTQPKAYIDVVGQDSSPDANMHFGTHWNTQTGIGAEKRLTIYYDGTVHVGSSMQKSPHGKFVVEGTNYDDFTTTNTIHYYQYASQQGGLTVVGDEAAIDIVGEDDGNHSASVLLRNGTKGFGFINDPQNNKLQLRAFTTSSSNFYVHGAGGSNVSTLVDVMSFERDGDVEVHNKLMAEGIIVNSDVDADDSAPTRVDLINTSNVDPSMRINFFEGSYNADYSLSNMYIEYNGGTADPDGSDGHLAIGGYNSGGASWNPNTANQDYLIITREGNIYPGQNGEQDLGGANYRWANVYTSDLHLSNEAKGPNDIDGTTGNWTVVEGEDELYIKNNKTGKKYAFMLREID